LIRIMFNLPINTLFWFFVVYLCLDRFLRAHIIFFLCTIVPLGLLYFFTILVSQGLRSEEIRWKTRKPRRLLHLSIARYTVHLSKYTQRTRAISNLLVCSIWSPVAPMLQASLPCPQPIWFSSQDFASLSFLTPGFASLSEAFCSYYFDFFLFSLHFEPCFYLCCIVSVMNCS
jgi:hypothetical protein